MHGLHGLVPNFGEKQTREQNTGANAIIVRDAPLMSCVIRVSRIVFKVKLFISNLPQCGFCAGILEINSLDEPGVEEFNA